MPKISLTRARAGAALLGAALLAGCSPVLVTTHDPTQDPLGPVELTTQVCAANYDGGSSGACGVPKVDTTVQLLAAYQLPDGVDDPQLSVDGQPGITFTRLDAYADALTAGWANGLNSTFAAAPADTGFHWVSFRSSPLEIHAGSAADWTVLAKIALPQSGGLPFTGPLTGKTAFGDQAVDPAAPDAAPDCTGGAGYPSGYFAPPNPVIGGGGPILFSSASCLDAGITPFSIDTTDAVLSGPAGGATVEHGHAATVPFDLKTAGVDPASTDTLTVTGTSTLAGVAVAGPGSLSLAGDADRTVPVTITVPKKAAKGTYSITVRVADGDHGRSATIPLVVTRDDDAPATPAAPQQPSSTQTSSPAPQTSSSSAPQDAPSTSPADAGTFDLALPDGAVLPGGSGRVGLGDASCGGGTCEHATVTLLTRLGQLEPDAGLSAAARRHSVRLAVTRVVLGAGEKLHVAVRVGPAVRKLLARGRSIHAMVVVRTGSGKPRVIRVVLKRSLR